MKDNLATLICFVLVMAASGEGVKLKNNPPKVPPLPDFDPLNKSMKVS